MNEVLTLYSAEHNALDEVLLNKGIYHDDRDGRNHGGSHTNGVSGYGHAGLGVGHLLRSGGAGLILVQNFYQNGLHGLQLLRRGVQVSVKPAVPLVDGGKQGNRHQNGFGQRDNELEEETLPEKEMLIIRR